jgi:hypothetical protein
MSILEVKKNNSPIKVLKSGGVGQSISEHILDF